MSSLTTLESTVSLSRSCRYTEVNAKTVSAADKVLQNMKGDW